MFSDLTSVLFRKLSSEKQTLAVLGFAENQLCLWSCWWQRSSCTCSKASWKSGVCSRKCV